MTTVSQLIAEQANANMNKSTWGDILINVKAYGAVGNGTTDDTMAFVNALAAIKAAGGGVLFLPKGSYKVNAALDISGVNNLTIEGVGVDASIIITNSATADVFVCTTSARWQKFKDFTVSSSVTKTNGAHFNYIGAAYRITWESVKIKGHFNGIKLDSFEQCWIDKVQIAEPTGDGTAIQVGKPALAATGANLNITNCFIRGTNGVDGVGGAEVGNYGVIIYDADAVFMENTDIGGNLISDLMITPNTRAANHYFSQCFFDATTNGPCVSMEGSGVKMEITFTGCWMGAAGQNTGGSNTAAGLWVKNIGSYRGLQFTGCRFHLNKGSGVKYEAGGKALFSGCVFENNGQGGIAGENYGFYLNSVLNDDSAHIKGCVFETSNGDDIYITANCRLYTVQDTYLTGTFTNLGTAKKISGIVTSNSNVVASATNITLPAGLDYIVITGTANIAGIKETYQGHMVTFNFSAALVVISMSQNLWLAGDFTTVANSTLTLICDGSQWREIARKA